MGDVRVRRAVAADLPTINALGEELQGPHADRYPEIFVRTGLLPYWEKTLAAEDHAIFVAERDTVVIGLALAQLMDETSPVAHPMKFCRLNVIVVSEKARGAGAGSMLIRAVEEFARAAGVRDIRLSVAAFNDPAIGLYERMGYEIRFHIMGKPVGKPS